MDGKVLYKSVKLVARLFLGGCLVFAGLSHLLWARIDFLAQVPPWLPLDPATVVLVSGIVEIGMGLCVLIFQKQRALVGWVVATFLVAVFPGNIAQWMYHRDAFHMHTDHDRLVRLFIQPVFIAFVLWSTDAWAAYRNTRRAK